jgi:hypothetical protein
MKRAEIAVALIGATISTLAWGGFGFSFGASAFVGAALATANLVVLSRSVARLLEGSSPKWAMVALLKFIVLFGVTFVLIRRALVEPLGLAVGFGALPLGILLASAFGGERFDEKEESTDSDSTAKEMDHA